MTRRARLSGEAAGAYRSGAAAKRLLPAFAAMAVLLAACGTQPPRSEGGGAPAASAPSPSPAPRRGGFYKDDGPADSVPVDLAAIPDASPRAEPLHRFANNPYSVLGRDYVPLKELSPYKMRGIGSWYGRKFHGQKTSSGEIYDMFAMTAAHPTLPIPSYVRVTNLANGKSVVVRINDRGPFLHDRVIDLSYAAAWKLGYVGSGSALVEVESILPSETQLAAAPPAAPGAGEIAAAQAAPPALPEVREPRGTFLQLGAFGNADNAESFRAHLARQLDWLAEPISIRLRDGLYRLHLGPYRDAQEAGRVAERIRGALSLEPFVIQR